MLLQHFLDGAFELAVVASEVVLGGVVDLNIGQQWGVLAVVAAHVTAAYLRDAEDHRVIDQRLPPDGGHRARHGGTDEFADTQFLIDKGEAVAVAVVVLTHEYAGRLGPLVERVGTNHLAMRHKFLVLLAAEQGAQVVVQPAAAVVAFIDDDGLAVAVLVAEQFTIDGAERWAVHFLDMDIGQLTAREAVHQGTVAVHPALVEQFILLALADGLDCDIRALLGRRVVDGDMDGLASLAIKHPVVILASQNVVTIDFLDDAAGGDTCLLHVKGTTLDDLLDT